MSLLGELTYALIASPGTRIGNLIPHVTVEEIYRDEVVTTDHPVERGAAITDHAFKRPVSIEIRCGWSNATAGVANYAAQVYAQLVALQEQSRIEPLDIVTPRRMYRSMVLSGLQAQRDHLTENVLACSIVAREVIIVSTKTTGAPTSAQADPATTASPSNSGTQSTGGKYDFAGPFNPGANSDYVGAGSAGYMNTVPGGGTFVAGDGGGAGIGGSGGLAGFDEITFEAPGGAATTIPGPGMTYGSGANAPPLSINGPVGGAATRSFMSPR